MNVVVLNDFASSTGGSDRAALGDAIGLARRGHHVTLLAGHGEPDPELLEAGVVVHTAGQRPTRDDPRRARAATNGIWNRVAAALVREGIAGRDPRRTIVHLHGFVKVLSPSVVRAVVDSKLPALATLHDYFAACPNGGFFIYPRGEICRLTPLSARCVATDCDARTYSHKLWRVARAVVQQQAGLMPRGLRHFIVPSQFAADLLRPFLPARAGIHVIANPLAMPQPQPAEVARNEEFLFVGRLERDKGATLFARAAARAGVRAVFVGAGKEAAAIRRAQPAAELTGWLEPDEVQARLRRARALVSASLWYETQGLVPLEAAAHGVPAIVPDTGVLREAVVDGQTGFWFRGGSFEDLTAKIRLLAADGELGARLGRAAYERYWRAPLEVEAHLDRLEELYRAIIQPVGAASETGGKALASVPAPG